MSPTTITGRRGGCRHETEGQLTALAPHHHVGQTHSTHPTFVWFVPDERPVAMEFRLYSVQAQGMLALIQTTQMRSTQGIMSFSLPRDEPGLRGGQHYVWQVRLICDALFPSGAVITGAEIEVIPMPVKLAHALKQTDDLIDRASLYGDAGLWYDALESVIRGTDNHQRQVFRAGLLRQLADLEAMAEGNIPNRQRQSIKLRKVVELMGWDG